MEIAAVLAIGLGGLWFLKSRTGAAARRRAVAATRGARRSSVRRSVAARDEDVLECGGIWARHPLDPEAGWRVATTAPWALRPGDRLCVTRRDGSESLETVERVLLELREPEGDVVGHLVEVENV